jgi:hypothetical protein
MILLELKNGTLFLVSGDTIACTHLVSNITINLELD